MILVEESCVFSRLQSFGLLVLPCQYPISYPQHMARSSQDTSAVFGRLLQQTREAAGLSRGQLATRVGVDPSYIWRIEERGQRRPSAEMTLTLADALAVGDESLNRWLVTAGHEPIPLVASVRPLIRSRGKSRRSGSMPLGTAADAVIRAKRLEDLGFTNELIDRLLTSVAVIPLPDQELWAKIITQSLSYAVNAMRCPVKVAVIPAAGGLHRVLGGHITQRLVLSAIREAFDVGIQEIVMVLAPGDREILYEPISLASTMALLPSAKSHYVEQLEPLGLGDAILRSRSFLEGKPFAVLLPDDAVHFSSNRNVEGELGRMLNALRETANAHILAVTPIAKTAMMHCGVATVKRQSGANSLGSIVRLAEKPDRDDPICTDNGASGIVGRYILQPSIFPALEEIARGSPRLVELTDALELLRSRGGLLRAVEVRGKRTDIGEAVAYANYAIKNSSI